jgi:hypothetical protein
MADDGGENRYGNLTDLTGADSGLDEIAEDEHAGTHLCNSRQVADKSCRGCRTDTDHRARKSRGPQGSRGLHSSKALGCSRDSEILSPVKGITAARMGQNAAQSRTALLYHAPDGDELFGVAGLYTRSMAIAIDLD